MTDEPSIVINGEELTTGQAMAVRVAITMLHQEMGATGILGDDEHGIAMTAAYRARLTEVVAIVLRGPPDPAYPATEPWQNLDSIIDALEAAGCCKNGRVYAAEDVVAHAIREWLRAARRAPA